VLLTFLPVNACSASNEALIVRPKRLVTIGDRTFLDAVTELWYKLPDDVAASHLLTAFHFHLKSGLF